MLRKRITALILLPIFILFPLCARANESGMHSDQHIEEYSFDFEDVYLLGQLMEHEASGEGEEGLTAVAEVVCNRIISDYFPNTISEVIFQKNQFTEATEITGIIPDIETLRIAERILRGKIGVLNDKSILFFKNAGGSTEDWGNLKYVLTINHHQFYRL